MQNRRSVALLVETSNAYARGILEGINRYVRQHEAWSIYLPEQERAASPPKWLADWQGDGIIARVETDEIARFVQKKKLPIVDVSAARLIADSPWVETNDEAVAKLAADHLIQRGFQHFGFYGDAGFNWSIWRSEHFEKLIRQAGHHCHHHTSLSRRDKKYSWSREKKGLSAWLNQLPKPIGIMACYDIKAQQLLDVCRAENIAVPEQVAVIGTDNDRLLCELADPPLSSVIPNAHQTGYTAASLLDQMMSGQKISTKSYLIEPLGKLKLRQSTDALVNRRSVYR